MDEERVKRILSELVCEGDVYDEELIRNAVEKILVLNKHVEICCKTGVQIVASLITK